MPLNGGKAYHNRGELVFRNAGKAHLLHCDEVTRVQVQCLQQDRERGSKLPETL
jgi:hypothetical protein